MAYSFEKVAVLERLFWMISELKNGRAPALTLSAAFRASE